MSPDPIRNAHRPRAQGGAPSAPIARAGAEAAVADWLATQGRVVSLWRELLVANDGDPELVAALDGHARFLAQAGRRL